MGSADPVDDFVDRAITPCGDDGFIPLGHGPLRLRLGIAGALGCLDHHVAGESFQALEASPDASSGRIGDDADTIQDWLLMNRCDRIKTMRALRWILWAVAIIVVLAVVAIAAGMAWLNTFIHSESFRQEVELRAGRSLGGQVQIETVNFDLINGVKLQGFSYQVDPDRVKGPGAFQMKIEKVDCGYAWAELFHRRLKLTAVTLDQPQIVLTRQPTAPLAPPAAGPATSATPSGPTQGNTSGEGTPMPFQFILDRAKVSNGAISIQDAAGASLVDLKGVHAEADTSGFSAGKDVTGTLKIADVLLPPNWHVTNFSTPFSYDQAKGGIVAKSFEASAFEGNIRGDYQSQGPGDSTLDLNGKGFDVAQLTAATTSNSSAKLSGSLDVQSKWHGVESGIIDGEGDAQLTNGKLEGVKILHDLSRILKVNELSAPVITKAQAHFVVKDGQTNFIGLQLNSPIFQITGDGTVGFDGQLNASLVLILTSDAMAKLPTAAAASFVQKQDGTGSIAFQVTGTTSKPETDLPEKLLLQNTQIKNVIDKALNKFFH